MKPGMPKAVIWLVVAFGLVLAAAWVRWSGSMSALIPVPNMEAAATLFYLVLFVPLAGLAWLLGRVCAVPSLPIGIRPFRLGMLGLILGTLGIGISMALAWANAHVMAGESIAGPGAVLLLLGLLLTLVQTTAEEMLFRGWLQGTLYRLIGPPAAIALTAVCFAALHMAGSELTVHAFINLALAGLLFGLLAWQSRGLAAPIAAHFAWNAVEDIGFGMVPNPGIGAFGAVYDVDVVGPAIWGGSDIGLNASIATSAVLLILVIALAMPRKKI